MVLNMSSLLFFLWNFDFRFTQFHWIVICPFFVRSSRSSNILQLACQEQTLHVALIVLMAAASICMLHHGVTGMEMEMGPNVVDASCSSADCAWKMATLIKHARMDGTTHPDDAGVALEEH